MASYNAINGCQQHQPALAHRHPQAAMGFQGFVVSDLAA